MFLSFSILEAQEMKVVKGQAKLSDKHAKVFKRHGVTPKIQENIKSGFKFSIKKVKKNEDCIKYGNKIGSFSKNSLNF